MPSYLSSTQTSGPSRRDDLRGVLGRRGEHELERMEEGQRGVAELVVTGEAGQPPDVADEHARPFDVVERAVEGLGDGRLDEALAQADPQVAAQHLDDVLGRQRVGPLEERAQDGRLAGRPGCQLDLGEGGGHLGERRTRLGRRLVAGGGQDLRHRDAQVGRSVVRLAEGGPRHLAEVGHRRRDGRPAEAGGPLIRFGEGASGQEDRRDGKLVGGDRPEVVGQDGRLLGGSGGRREALGELAPATHAGMVYRARDGAETVVPGGAGRLAGRPPATRAGEHRGVPALVRRPGDRPARAVPGDPDAARGDRALLRGAGPGHRRPRDGRPREGHRSARRDVRVQPARRRQRIRALPHHHRRVGRLGPGARHRVDPADGRSRLRDARPPPDRAVRLRVQRPGHPRLPALRIRHRRPVPRVDLARRTLVGRAGDERPRVRLASATRRRGDGRDRRRRGRAIGDVPDVVEVGAAERSRRTFGRWR